MVMFTEQQLNKNMNKTNLQIFLGYLLTEIELIM